ncbi:MAG: PrgI family protein [Patescibacteria group bacterium]|jgi:hypothetical protein
MQQFTVPQFIDVENQIIGPITTRQFMIFLVGAIICGISYKLVDFSLFITITIIVFVVMVLFAFVKINGRPFHFFVLNAVQTWRRPNLRVWHHQGSSEGEEEKVSVDNFKSSVLPPKVFKRSRLAELALIVDTKGKYQGE